MPRHKKSQWSQKNKVSDEWIQGSAWCNSCGWQGKCAMPVKVRTTHLLASAIKGRTVRLAGDVRNIVAIVVPFECPECNMLNGWPEE